MGPPIRHKFEERLCNVAKRPGATRVSGDNQLGTLLLIIASIFHPPDDCARRVLQISVVCPGTGLCEGVATSALGMRAVRLLHFCCNRRFLMGADRDILCRFHQEAGGKARAP